MAGNGGKGPDASTSKYTEAEACREPVPPAPDCWYAVHDTGWTAAKNKKYIVCSDVYQDIKKLS